MYQIVYYYRYFHHNTLIPSGGTVRGVDDQPIWYINNNNNQRVSITQENQIPNDKYRKKGRIWVFSTMILSTSPA